MIETVLSLLDLEPVEDGVLHSADLYISRELKKGVDVKELYSWCYENLERESSCLASVLRCIGRLEKKIAGEDGKKLMSKALENQDQEVRDAAIRAFEKWGGQDSINTLEQYVAFEKAGWLRDYANRVIRDLL